MYYVTCGKKCVLSGDYDKIVSNIKKLMQDPCSRSVFVFFFMFLLWFCICFLVFVGLFFHFFFLFSLCPLWVLISGIKPKEA